MKLAVLLAFVATVCYVSGEVCQNVTTCSHTICGTSAGHVHLECYEKHCTCMKDAAPCLTVSDCSNVRCITTSGSRAVEHCLDGSCLCLSV